MYTLVRASGMSVTSTLAAAPVPMSNDTNAPIGEDADRRGRLARAPRETSQIWLNTLKSQITNSIVMTIRLGLISGTVIC